MKAVQCIAAKKDFTQLRIVKRFDAEMIARAKQLPVGGVPERKGKIALQAIDAGCAPCCICAQNQITVRRIRTHVLLSSLQFGDQFLARVEPGIRNDPVASLEIRWLPLVLRFVCGAQQRVAHADGTVRPDPTSIRSTKRKKISKGLQQPTVNWWTVPVHDANESAQ